MVGKKERMKEGRKEGRKERRKKEKRKEGKKNGKKESQELSSSVALLSPACFSFLACTPDKNKVFLQMIEFSVLLLL